MFLIYRRIQLTLLMVDHCTFLVTVLGYFPKSKNAMVSIHSCVQSPCGSCPCPMLTSLTGASIQKVFGGTEVHPSPTPLNSQGFEDPVPLNAGPFPPCIAELLQVSFEFVAFSNVDHVHLYTLRYNKANVFFTD